MEDTRQTEDRPAHPVPVSDADRAFVAQELDRLFSAWWRRGGAERAAMERAIAGDQAVGGA